MSLFPTPPENALYLSMDDQSDLLSRNSPHPFKLDQHSWATVEHYYQAMQFVDAEYQRKIRQAETPQQALKLGKSWFKRKRSDIKKVRTTIMTRAIYTQCRTYPEIADYLLSTGNRPLIENSQFDYYWGCGRDYRGKNHYGKVLENVRDKLNSESK